MSKPTTLRTNRKSTTKNVEIKQREASKDRNGLRKIIKLVENENGSPVNIKSKPPVKTTESPSRTLSNGIKRNIKNELNKSDQRTKPKVENHRSSLIAPNKTSPKVNKTLTTAPRTSTSTSQGMLTKIKRSVAPETPPSTRVTKSQFFPSKKMYSNVVKEQLKTKPTAQRVGDFEATTSNREHGVKRILALNETKLKNHKSEAVTKTNEKPKSPKNKNKVPHNMKTDSVERPRTATLKRGSIVNSNIAGPDIPVSETPSLTSLDLSYEQEETKQEETKQEEEDYNYEDDFDSYESDFEEYQSSDSFSSSNDDNIFSGQEATTSDDSSSFDDSPKQSATVGTDEERMLDSGNFDMPENKHKQLLDNIKESNEQENFTVELTEQSRSNMASLSDEGFEEGKSSLQSGNMQFINFVDAQKKWKQGKNFEKRRKRGEEILNMIRLDHYYFTIIDMPPISYDDFIKSYGKTNTIQVPTQTGDDDTSEEVQTDVIETASKWTQFPITFSKIDGTNSNYLEIYKKEFIGVGDDSVTKADSVTKQDFPNLKLLKKFITIAKQTVLTLLEESNNDTSEQINKNQREIPFSNGYIKFATNIHPFLKHRPITFVSYCSTTNTKVLTVHGRNEGSHENELSLKSIVCIWCILNSKYPEKTLSVTGELRVCCFTSDIKNLIFGGSHDGSIVMWDISEDNQLEPFTTDTNYMQLPTYTTDIGCGHSSTIVSIQSLTNATDNFVHGNLEWKPSNNQICSLDDNGILIVWGVITKNSSSFDNFKQHTAMPWAHVSLVQNSKISLKDFNPDLTDLCCTDMNINVLDPRHLFISTNYGYVIHCLTTETKANPKKFNPGMALQANCIETCPFSPLYFFAGHDDGAIVLYSRLLEKPLMIMSNKDDTVQSGIQSIQWSHHRPCVFYAKDHCNTIHVWDLAISDLYPIYSVPFKETITCMELSPTLIKNNDTAYMILATEGGSVQLHILNTEYGPSTLHRYQQDMKKFLNYVSRL